MAKPRLSTRVIETTSNFTDHVLIKINNTNIIKNIVPIILKTKSRDLENSVKGNCERLKSKEVLMPLIIVMIKKVSNENGTRKQQRYFLSKCYKYY